LKCANIKKLWIHSFLQSIISLIRSLYENLASKAQSIHERTFCEAAVDEIEPLIRLCDYHLKTAKGMDIDLEELIDIRNQTESLGLESLASQIEVFLA
jgi:hypothetical protein